MGRKLYKTFPLIRKWMDTIAAHADFDLLKLLFQGDIQELTKTEFQQPALFMLEYALFKQLEAFGMRPAAMAGHSMGELSALCASGCFDYEDGFAIINTRAQLMAKASSMTVDPGAMLAVNAPQEYIDDVLADNDKLFITNFNSPRQTVFGGAVHEIAKLKSALDRQGYWNVRLGVSMAFHSPIMKIIRDEFADHISGLNIKPPKVPVLSNATNTPYPADGEKIKRIIVDHLESPVNWQGNVRSLIDDYGCRFFVEIGPQGSLCSLINECDADVRCSERLFCRQ